ncbi:MAG: tail fiber domain-containing protein, partial [Parafilimonas sp.]
IGNGNVGFYNVQKASYPFYIDSTDNSLFNWNNSQRKYGKVNVYNNQDLNSTGIFAQGETAGLAGYAGKYDSTNHKFIDNLFNYAVVFSDALHAGVYGEADQSIKYSANDEYYGVLGVATSPYNSVGVYGSSVSDYGVGTSGLNAYFTTTVPPYVGKTRAYGSLGNRFPLIDPQTHTSQSLTTGVYGVIVDTIGENRYAVYSNGNLALIGNMYTLSDEKFKTDIKPMQNALDIIKQLQPKTYQFVKADKGYTFPKEKQYGLLAQDVQKILPELVQQTAIPKTKNWGESRLNVNGKSADEGKAVTLLNYQAFIPLLIKSTQELNIENDSLKNVVNSMQSQLNDVTKKLNYVMQLMQSTNNAESTSTVTELASLEQNTPNPFNGSTIIKYYLPAQISNAKVVISDANGHNLKTISLSNKGAGQVNITAGTLSSGSYFYSLLIDGKKIDTKQMILTK